MRILFYSHDRGGANLLIRVAQELVKKGETCLYLGHGPSAHVWTDSDVEGLHLSEHLLERNVRAHIRKFRPNLVVTGTSIFSYGEQQIWRISRSLGIPSLALVDGWSKIRDRFQSRNSRLVVPDRFGVVDTYTKRLLARTCNVSPSRIGVVGHPHLEEFSVKLIGARSMRSQSKILTIGFFSTPIVNAEADPGIRVAQSLLESLPPHQPLKMLIKPHPREETHPWQQWSHEAQSDRKFENIQICLASEQSTFDILAHVDVVVGLPTSVLIEAALSGIPTIAIEPRWWPTKNIAIARFLSENVLRDASEIPQEFFDILNKEIRHLPETGVRLFKNSRYRAIKMIRSSTRSALNSN